jgi:hypothetical protein
MARPPRITVTISWSRNTSLPISRSSFMVTLFESISFPAGPLSKPGQGDLTLRGLEGSEVG